MAKKLTLKLKSKGGEAAAAPAAAGSAAPAGGAGGITLELRGATIDIEEVIVRRKK
jgi:hypothetical protein